MEMTLTSEAMSTSSFCYSQIGDFSEEYVTEPDYVKHEATYVDNPSFEHGYILREPSPEPCFEPEYTKLEPTYRLVPFEDIPNEEFRREDFEDLFRMIQPNSVYSSTSDDSSRNMHQSTPGPVVPPDGHHTYSHQLYTETRSPGAAEPQTTPVPWNRTLRLNQTQIQPHLTGQQPITTRHTQTDQKPTVASLMSQFLPPKDLGRELLSGIEQLRAWNGEEVPETKPYHENRTAPIPDKYSSQSLTELLSQVTNLGRQSTKRKTDEIDKYAGKSRMYECPVCHRVLHSLSNLRHHRRTHTGEKPYGCHICLKRFTMKSTLTTHMRIHTGSKPYKCERCPKSFRDLSTFTKHQRVHTGERPYTCSVCHREFTQMGNMKRHSINIHGVVSV